MPSRPELLLAPLLIALAAGCHAGNGTNISQEDGVTTVTVGGTAPVEGSGKAATEDRTVEGFHAVRGRNGVEVVAEVAGAESAIVEADDNLLALVETKVVDGTLEVGVKRSLKTRNPIKVKVSAKRLEGLAAESAAKVGGTGLRADRVTLSAAGSGRVTAGKVDADRVIVTVSSAGVVAADGRADRQEVEASSSGRYEGGKLISRAATVACGSAASADVHATGELTGTATSAGSVRYSGNPGKVEVSAGSAGTVQPAGK